MPNLDVLEVRESTTSPNFKTRSFTSVWRQSDSEEDIFNSYECDNIGIASSDSGSLSSTSSKSSLSGSRRRRKRVSSRQTSVLPTYPRFAPTYPTSQLAMKDSKSNKVCVGHEASSDVLQREETASSSDSSDSGSFSSTSPTDYDCSMFLLTSKLRRVCGSYEASSDVLQREETASSSDSSDSGSFLSLGRMNSSRRRKHEVFLSTHPPLATPLFAEDSTLSEAIEKLTLSSQVSSNRPTLTQEVTADTQPNLERRMSEPTPLHSKSIKTCEGEVNSSLCDDPPIGMARDERKMRNTFAEMIEATPSNDEQVTGKDRIHSESSELNLEEQITDSTLNPLFFFEHPLPQKCDSNEDKEPSYEVTPDDNEKNVKDLVKHRGMQSSIATSNMSKPTSIRRCFQALSNSNQASRSLQKLVLYDYTSLTSSQKALNSLLEMQPVLKSLEFQNVNGTFKFESMFWPQSIQNVHLCCEDNGEIDLEGLQRLNSTSLIDLKNHSK